MEPPVLSERVSKNEKKKHKREEKAARKIEKEKNGPPVDFEKMKGNKPPKPNKSFITYYQSIVPEEQWQVTTTPANYERTR